MSNARTLSREHELVTAWRDLLSQHARIWCELDRRMHAEHQMSASAFEALDRLADADCEKLRVQELADSIHLTQSALSRLLTHLEEEGSVLRAVCEVDRRGVYVQLTEKGRKRHKEAAPTHRAVLTEQL